MNFSKIKDASALVKEVSIFELDYNKNKPFFSQLDQDKDGKLSFKEFKVLFENNEARRRSQKGAGNSSSAGVVRVGTAEHEKVLAQIAGLSFATSAPAPNTGRDRTVKSF